MHRTWLGAAALLALAASCSGEPERLTLTYFNIDG